MSKKQINKKNDGRASDLKFLWLLTTLGKQWLQWQQYASEWMEQAAQQTATASKRKALTIFFEFYVQERTPYAVDVLKFFNGHKGHICSSEEFKLALLEKGNADDTNLSQLINNCTDFLDWVIENHYCATDDNGVNQQLFKNPLTKIKSFSSRTETVKTPLPYRYMQDLRDIICPTPIELQTKQEKINKKRYFKDWIWAQNQTGQSWQNGDWFDVEPDNIDKSDLDCVWRIKTKEVDGKKCQIYQMWSPVAAMVIYIKLHLPLRTYQVRMLDSGEADTYRYINGGWEINNINSFSLGSSKRPYEKGVFKRIYDNMTGSYSTGLYINSNKSTDRNKDEFDRGYTIPWQNEEVLFWLEKLRNWQEKYNPITQPTVCTSLKNKHIGMLKGKNDLHAMGEISFLFRDASAKGNDKVMPIPPEALKRQWYQLLLKLENQLFDKGKRLDKGQRLKIVKDYPPGTPKGQMYSTLFPLHSLRVSLITCYVMDTNLPLPVISKLLAGHSHLLMSIYYTKITPSIMAIKMEECEAQLESRDKESIKNFLKDASMEQIKCKMVYHNESAVSAVLVNRNPIGWEERSSGICLVGGNTVKSDEVSTLGGCWNGGQLIKDSVTAKDRVYGAVPNGPENCVRCRWFMTEAKYLSSLIAHLNQVSYKANQSANFVIEFEELKEQLMDEEFKAQQEGLPFIKYEELQLVQRRLEKQTVDANNHTEDFIATFNLINRITQIEDNRTLEDTKDKLIAVGDLKTINQSIKFLETDSELLHLSVICDDAEFYPDLEDELRKTPAIEKRSRMLNRILMKKNFKPLFMEMDDKQQLITANAMLRHMAKISDPDDKLEGYRKVCGYLEAEEYMQDLNLLDEGVGVLQPGPIQILIKGDK